jgi:hypothetical protein
MSIPSFDPRSTPVGSNTQACKEFIVKSYSQHQNSMQSAQAPSSDTGCLSAIYNFFASIWEALKSFCSCLCPSNSTTVTTTSSSTPVPHSTSQTNPTKSTQSSFDWDKVIQTAARHSPIPESSPPPRVNIPPMLPCSFDPLTLAEMENFETKISANPVYYVNNGNFEELFRIEDLSKRQEFVQLIKEKFKEKLYSTFNEPESLQEELTRSIKTSLSNLHKFYLVFADTPALQAQGEMEFKFYLGEMLTYLDHTYPPNQWRDLKRHLQDLGTM